MSDPTPQPEPAVPDPVEPASGWTDSGAPTFSRVRETVEARAATAGAAAGLAADDDRAREAEDAFAERERRAAERLAEIRRSLGG